MATYKHHVNLNHKTKRVKKTRQITQIFVVLILIMSVYVGVDWIITNIRSSRTVVSSESSATVQSAQINIFQSPFFRFQSDSSWREVTDELNLKDQGDTRQYLYRRFDKNFIEHEIWVTVNLPDNYVIPINYIPTRVLPARIESDGSITQIGSVSKPCVDVLPKDNPNLESHTVTQNDIEYFCNPNEVNDYHVTVGVPGATNRLSAMHDSSQKAEVTITYRNITAIPTSSMFENILATFKLL